MTDPYAEGPAAAPLNQPAEPVEPAVSDLTAEAERLAVKCEEGAAELLSIANLLRRQNAQLHVLEPDFP